MSFNNHSRSNSDCDMLSYKEILPIFLEDFLRDFSFNDIYFHLLNCDIFTQEELNRIKTLQDSQLWSIQELESISYQEFESRQTLLMFTIVIDKRDDIIRRFLDILKKDYSWLTKKVLNAYKIIENKDHLQYLSAVYELRTTFPKHYDFNVRRLKYYCTIRNHLRELKPKNYLTIYGELGFGKKWLALDACCDFATMKKFGFKVYWIDVHNCNSRERDLEKLQQLKILLGECNFRKKSGDYEGIDNKILELQQELRAILRQTEYKNCLLILADVQNRKTLETFDLRCKILITTRNKKLKDYMPTSLNKVIHIQDGLTKFEYLNMFEKILMKSKKFFPDNSTDLYDYSKGHPFLLNMIAKNLKQQISDEWSPWIRNLEKFKIDDKIASTIQLSLNVLNNDEMNLFKTLTIFHHSVKIPVKVLAALWKKNDLEAKNIIFKFDKFSLITKAQLSDGSMACVIHFLYHSYLKTSTICDNRIELHRNLVENYRISNALNHRYEYDLVELPNDDYFHYFIGYHLREANMIEYFPKLYLDFGFLGQKLRASGLPNTIGDLKYYRSEITGGDKYREQLVDSLLEFLPNIEEMIFRSSDTYLLQYALMGNGILHEEAYKQVQQFPDKIFFIDGYEYPNILNPTNSLKNIKRPTEINSSGHFHRRRQMISLPYKPKHLKLIEPDTCLIALDNNIMLLADLSLGYSIEPTKFEGHRSEIIEMEMFAKNFIISLDREGEVRIWSIVDERRRSLERKHSSRSVVNHIDFNIERMRKKECVQVITKNIDGQKIKVQNFHLDNYSDERDIYLHLVFNNGDICIYKWSENQYCFEAERIPTLHSRILNIRFLVKLFDEYYILLNNTGSLKIYKLLDSSKSCFSFEWPQDTDAPIRVHYFKTNVESVIFVFGMKILQANFPKTNFEFLKGDLQVLYETQDRRSAITCSCLSDDNRYLIIGTKQGIIVFDVIEKSEMLRNSISESIVCVDIYTLDDPIYKYIIVSGSEKYSVLNIFGLKMSGNESITWSNSIGTLGKEKTSNPQFEPNAWLLGEKMFDVNFRENSSSLVAVDSKNRIHRMTTENKNWSLFVPKDINCKITAITSLDNLCFYGCECGKIYYLTGSNDNFSSGSSSSTLRYGSFSDESDLEEEELFHGIIKEKPITYLKLFNKNLLVASSSQITKCLIVFINTKQVFDKNISVVNSFIAFNDQFLILIDENCYFYVINCAKNCEILYRDTDIFEKFYDNPNGPLLGGADYKDGTFVIGTIKSDIFTYRINLEESNQLLDINVSTFQRSTTEEITCIAVSRDTNLCAVGLKSGQIEVYRYSGDQLIILQKLDSHKQQIYDLKFSPWQNDNLPIVLASSSEQLCFWDITYVLNNPLDGKRRRHSSRFNSTTSASNSPNRLSTINRSIVPIYPNTSQLNNALLDVRNQQQQFNQLQQQQQQSHSLQNQNVWSNKKGPSDKPELLSCIKYAGGRAEKFYANSTFTKFVTIDDEGEYYFLTVQDATLINNENKIFNNNDNKNINNNNNNNNNNILNSTNLSNYFNNKFYNLNINNNNNNYGTNGGLFNGRYSHNDDDDNLSDDVII
ncbi:uncharacterized protein LOC129613396 isoform X2 [Condylostylus longicornis]|uniref:uncharacterized protein LOC129613396 isoform X2 n=1 Tax=Condylostylus longicornis TaxID=2530218 RepID=UPI00244DCCAA|nr:uncharacterized protein LOC129613396 isoform X2 [Condylostylus longicornis]